MARLWLLGCAFAALGTVVTAHAIEDSGGTKVFAQPHPHCDVNFAHPPAAGTGTPSAGSSCTRRLHDVEFAFLQGLSSRELFEIGQLIGDKVTSPHPDVSGHDFDYDAGYDRHGQYCPAVIEAVCCLSSSGAFLVKEAIKELGYEQPAPHQRPCKGRLDLLRNQLVSPGPTAGRFACTSRMLMQAVREGYRSHKDGPFHIEGCHVKWFNQDEACRSSFFQNFVSCKYAHTHVDTFSCLN